jgi:MFS family permease
MVIGSVGMSFSLIFLGATIPLWLYTIVYLFLTVSSIFSSVPFNGLIADVTPEVQKSKMSAIMGSMNLAGYLVGALIGVFYDALGDFLTYGIMVIILLGGTLLSVISATESEAVIYLQEFQGWSNFFKSLYEPLSIYRNFRLVFFGRFLAQLGINTFQQFLQYWIQDCIVDLNMSSTMAVSLAMLPLLVISPISALLIPQNRRKVVVYITSSIMSLVCVLAMFVNTYVSSLVISGLFGLAYGIFYPTKSIRSLYKYRIRHVTRRIA